MTDNYILTAILMMALITFLLRLFPLFLLKLLKDSRLLNFLAVVMPPGIMVILVFYSLSNSALSAPFYGLNTLLCVTIVIIIHHSYRNPLLSIGLGTLCYVGIAYIY